MHTACEFEPIVRLYKHSSQIDGTPSVQKRWIIAGSFLAAARYSGLHRAHYGTWNPTARKLVDKDNFRTTVSFVASDCSENESMYE